MRSLLSVLLTLALAVPLALGFTGGALETTAESGDPCAGVICAGAASVDTTWHVGAGQGQYGGQGNGYTSDRWDPFHHQTHQVPSHGIESRTFAKAIVVQGPDGEKVAYVKTELYLQQDVLTRRVAELVTGDPTVPDFAVPGLNGSRIMLGATHNHSVPMYASTAWGVWLFTDTFDYRMFETTARRIAQAIKDADASLRPARIGASVTRFDDVQQNILGPGVADDGTPAGFPRDHFDDELTVIRVETADGGDPIAAWVNLGMHPESQDTTNMISSDFIGHVERLVERDLAASPGTSGEAPPAGPNAEDAPDPVVVWSQGGVGDVEPDRSRANPPSAGRQYWHEDYQQMARMSRDVAAAVLDTWADVDRPPARRGDGHDAAKHVAFTTDAPVGMVDYRFSGPVSHPIPTVSNCRTADPGLPAAGLPDCAPNESNPPEQYGETLELLHDHGVPVPDNYGPTSHGAVQESLRIHLQAIRIGEILLASCPCEAISDMTLNFKSRADGQVGNQFHGYEWPCREGGETGVECDFRHAAWQEPDWRPVDPHAHEHMLAQIRNDAAGWEDDHEHLQGEAEHGEHDDGHALYGNFTHTEMGAEVAVPGYRLPVLISQANDYIGYVVTYREYQRGDHYRKALTGFGPHTADYVNTRLVQMGAELKGGDGPEDAVQGPVQGAADELIQTAKSLAVGKASSAGLAAYEQAIPDDGGTPGTVLSEPEDGRRFREFTFSWEGGSNWTDSPDVVVQRQRPNGAWETVATQAGGEVITTLKYDSPFSDAPLLWLTGGKRYEWTARWEAFDETAPGAYRFVVDGLHRSGREANPYHVESRVFEVGVWDGIVAHDLTVDAAAGTASVAVDGTEFGTSPEQLETDEDATLAPIEVHYPDTYETDGPYIDASFEQIGPHVYCQRCSWRPWADTGQVADVTISVRRAGGGVTRHAATFDGQRWTASGLGLASGDTVVVEAGDAIDEHGNVNGAPSNAVTAP